MRGRAWQGGQKGMGKWGGDGRTGLLGDACDDAPGAEHEVDDVLAPLEAERAEVREEEADDVQDDVRDDNYGCEGS